MWGRGLAPAWRWPAGAATAGTNRRGTVSRKDDHIRINLEENVQSHGITNGLENVRLPHAALPEVDLDEIDTRQVVFGRTLETPLLISSMTGGTPRARELNERLATAAQATGVAMGLGSMRVALERAEVASTFAVRVVAPKILLLANLGAVQLNYGYTADSCRRVVDLVQADALVLHLNALQEAVQPEGNTRFAGLLRRIEVVARELGKEGVPVVVKEVGWGFSEMTSRRLAEAGVAAIDVAGAGGTSWSEVEMHRVTDPSGRRLARAFRGWGISTAEAIRNVRRGAPELTVFASGGLRDGVDAAKCLALGAHLAGMARPFLQAAVVSTDAVIREIVDTARELRVAMFCCGVRNLHELSQVSAAYATGPGTPWPPARPEAGDRRLSESHAETGGQIPC